ncbi:Bidirectional sugar transporter SWEET15 [Linum perenne]
MKGHHDHHAWITLTIGILGNITSIMMYLAPLGTFWRVYRRKSTEGFESVPYVAAHFSSMLWLYYAALRSNYLLLTVNLVGCVLETIYILVFIAYAPKKAKIMTVKLVSVTSFGGFIAIFVLTHLFAKGEVFRLEIIGWLCAALSCFMFAAPLSIIRQVVHTKSVEFMPLTLSFFLLMSAALWLVYGVLLHDYYLMVPNAVGVVLGMAQMILYGSYSWKRKTSEPNDVVVVAHPTENENETAATATATAAAVVDGLEVQGSC